jgi:hypothetical protein
MSTSDEQHAPDEPAPDEATAPVTGAEGTTTPTGAPSDGGEPGPAPEEPAAAAAEETPTVANRPPAGREAPSNPQPSPQPALAPVPPAPGAPSGGPAGPSPVGMPAAPMRPVSTPAPADLDASARHAALRPTPVPPEPATPTPTRPLPGTPERTPAGAAGAAGLAAGAGAVGAGAGHAAAGAAAPTTVMAPATTAAATPRAAEDATLFPDPNAPRTISVGTHVLGILVGIVLPAAAALVTALGISRILVVEVNGWIAKVDALGIVLVTLGALLLLACVLLSLWTPYVGLVGGAILTVAGAFALYAPGLARTGVLDVLTSEGWRPTVEETIVVATSGTVAVVGVLLLGAGIVSSVARRHGIHLGAFRERHRTA